MAARTARATTASSRAAITCTGTRVADAKEAEALADRSTNGLGVLSDAAGECQGVQAVERRCHGGDCLGDAVGEDLERELRAFIGGGDQGRDVAGAAEREQPGLVLQGLFQLGRRHAVAQEVEQCTRVDRPRACRHRHALERGESHRRIDRPSVAHGRDRATAAEVADDEARHRHLLRDPGDRQSVEAEALDSERSIPRG